MNRIWMCVRPLFILHTVWAGARWSGGGGQAAAGSEVVCGTGRFYAVGRGGDSSHPPSQRPTAVNWWRISAEKALQANSENTHKSPPHCLDQGLPVHGGGARADFALKSAHGFTIECRSSLTPLSKTNPTEWITQVTRFVTMMGSAKGMKATIKPGASCEMLVLWLPRLPRLSHL